ncbi:MULTISPECIES: MoxR family ATPase [unclassified Streptomyces]|uniref:AAA family ATPase n=1 Tax=unclassified Streptomyces TaxID=2593676 RepID=UPI00225BF27D|nr:MULTISPECIES: AAA family ATPase [unclassified Streptomyces]MCX4528801.1 AAA family ATPase [Streptomyces sp. NBC_01551]MCX4540591.1 AAA family ATPase [Streptomyces sp. NBC_01565]
MTEYEQEQAAPAVESAGSDGTAWRVFHATGAAPAGAPPAIPAAPPWREFAGQPLQPAPVDDDRAVERRLGADDPRPSLRDDEIDTVNAALLLRRPLLVTGPPGVGKSTLAYLVARELGLGRVLQWSIVSRTTLREGLYEYDSIGRAQAIATWRAGAAGPGPGAAADPAADPAGPEQAPQLGDFITLGPVGTALLAYERPRVLLIDELDKSDIDLPNDLLHALENGSYEVPELVRSALSAVSVFTDDPGGRAEVVGGRVECREFPLVVITSNGEREFPAAFRRRCLPLEMRPPGREQLIAIVLSHLRRRPEGVEALVDEFEKRVREGGTQSVDQLLNAVHLTTAGGFQADAHGRKLMELLLRDLAKGR